MKKIVNHLKKLYSRRPFLKIGITIAVICILFITVWAVQVFSIKQEKLDTQPVEGASPQLGEISLSAGDVLAAEDGGKELWINTENMVLTLKDTNTGKTWSTAVSGSQDGTALALLYLNCLGEDNNLYSWNSYDYCVEWGNYELWEIENGIQILMHISQGESANLYEYLPQKLPISRFEDFIQQTIADMMESGEMSAETGEKYLSTLSIIYKKSTVEECYAVAYNGAPPQNAVKQLIQMTKDIGYTHEMLEEDSEAFDLTVVTSEEAAFDLVLEATLVDGELEVRIPTSELYSVNDYYAIQNIEVLPNFGAVTGSTGEDGYMLVPDGAGALIRFNTGNPSVTDYVRPYYDNDYYTDFYYMPEYAEELMMPVYGMLYGDMGSEGGLFANITEGADTSYLHVKVANADLTGTAINRIYVSFDCMQYSKVSLYGVYSSSAGSYLVDTGMLDIDWTVRYSLYAEETSYYQMASDYQSYLLTQAGQEEQAGREEAGVYLEVIGALSLTERFIGIPYESNYSMTTYQELMEILGELSDIQTVVQYDGVFNNGLRNTINNKADLVGVNGSSSELTDLMDYADAIGTTLFYNVEFSRVYKDGDGYWARRHAVYDYNNSAAMMGRYVAAIGIIEAYADSTKYTYNQVSPVYLTSLVEGFLEDAGDYDNISVGDLASVYLADYRYNNMIQPQTASGIVAANLEKLSENKNLSLNNPRAEYASLASYAVEISRDSSEYDSFTMTIPFRQLVLNGITEYTTENINMSSSNRDYYILQAAELGAMPKFTITYKSVDVLSDSSYNYLYATEFADWKDDILEVYEETQDILEQVGSTKITNHSVVADNVFCTEYESGAQVITNYNKTAVTLEDGTVIEALGYIIEGGR